MKAIPTRYNNTEFRSRLEARWAAYFDLRGFNWVYEPIDLEGWAPDFLIHTPFAPIYAEVKPAPMHFYVTPNTKARIVEFPLGPEIDALYSKARERWRDYWVLLLGLEPDEWGHGYLLDPPPEMDRLWRSAHEYLGQNTNSKWLGYDEVRRLWREAGNRVQWKAPAA